jgi:hypothetical protein
MVELHHYHLIISLKSYIILIVKNRHFKCYEYNRMNTKSVVAKPKVAPKVVKAVVKKPKAMPKVAKAVVKKPKAVPKAVVKKPRKYNNINGGVGSGRISGTIAASMSRMSNNMFGKNSRAVSQAPQSPQAPQALQKTPIKSVKIPYPRILLYNIIHDYHKLLNLKVGFTVYDLIILINNMAENLNKFFEDFLRYYPDIIFKYPKNYKLKTRIFRQSLLNYQQYHLDILNIIVRYVRKIRGILVPTTGYNLTIYSGVLDGSQKGKTEYDKGEYKFFDSYKLEDLPEYIIKILKEQRFTFGDDIYYNYIDYNKKGSFYNIAMKINLILQEFFGHIQLMDINKSRVLSTYKTQELLNYIKAVKTAALKYFGDIQYNIADLKIQIAKDIALSADEIHY